MPRLLCLNTVALSKNSIHYSLSQQRSIGYLHYSAVKGEKKSHKLKKVNLKAFHTDNIEKHLSTVEKITRGKGGMLMQMSFKRTFSILVIKYCVN